MTDIEVDPYDLSDGQIEAVDRLVLRDELARTVDPEAFEDHPIEKRSSIAAIQWAARRHMALEAADKVMPWLSQHDTNIRNAVLAQHPIMAMPARTFADKDASGCRTCGTYGDCPTRVAITEATQPQSQDRPAGVEE